MGTPTVFSFVFVPKGNSLRHTALDRFERLGCVLSVSTLISDGNLFYLKRMYNTRTLRNFATSIEDGLSITSFVAVRTTRGPYVGVSRDSLGVSIHRFFFSSICHRRKRADKSVYRERKRKRSEACNSCRVETIRRYLYFSPRTSTILPSPRALRSTWCSNTISFSFARPTSKRQDGVGRMDWEFMKRIYDIHYRTTAYLFIYIYFSLFFHLCISFFFSLFMCSPAYFFIYVFFLFVTSPKR